MAATEGSRNVSNVSGGTTANSIGLPIIGGGTTSVDIKGRLLVPQRIREALGNPVVMMIGRLRQVVVYPVAVFGEFVDTIRGAPHFNEGREMFSRFVMSMADDGVMFDSQGRIVIPEALRDEASISSKVRLVGGEDRLEIWSEPHYQRYLADMDAYEIKHRTAVTAAYDRMVNDPFYHRPNATM